MSQEEYLEFNIRCAKFLGWKETTEEFKIDWVGCKTIERLKIINPTYIPILEKDGDVLFPDFSVMDFTKDWNWIMEVVEAIEKIKEVRDVVISSTGCIIFHKEKPFSSHVEDKKEAVVQAINQVLIWYNEQNNNLKL
jgi:hypothetical protein